MSSSLYIKEGWLRALVFFFVGMIVSGVIASVIESLLYQGLLGGNSPSQTSPLSIFIIYVINQIGFLGCLWFFRRRVDDKSFMSLGLSWRGFTKDAFMGMGVAVVTISAGTILLYLGNNLTIRGINFDFMNMLMATLLFVVVAFVEEIIVRGYILNNLMESMNRWLALFISAFLFSLMHIANPDVTLIAQVNIFVAGILLGVNYIYTKNLWFAIFFHFSWNFFQGTVLGYHVSGLHVDSGLIEIATTGPDEITGGVFGFEGSAFAAILQIIAIIALAIYYERKYGKSLIVKKEVKKVVVVETSSSSILED